MADCKNFKGQLEKLATRVKRLEAFVFEDILSEGQGEVFDLGSVDTTSDSSYVEELTQADEDWGISDEDFIDDDED